MSTMVRGADAPLSPSAPPRPAGPRHGPDEKLHEFLLAAARTTPDAPAVVECTGDGDPRVVSYRELERLVRDYAGTLDRLGLDIGDRVILESDTSACAIAAFVACSSLGLTFVPVSPEAPDQRLGLIIDTTRAALFLQASHGRREAVAASVGTARFGPSGLVVERAPQARHRHRRELTDTDTAYMIFTSGTTGRPKGVVMSHRAVVSFYRGMLRHGIVDSSDRVATTSPLQFDFSLLDIGLALGSGAAVVPVPRASLRWPSRFLRVLRDTGATQVDGVPSIWRQALRHLPERLAELDRVRGVLFCGEDFPLPELRQLQRLLPSARIVNCYGATESMACSFTDVPNPLPEGLARLSIGFAHPGAEMMIVDSDGDPIEAPDVVGEIHLRSPALFTGYWDDPEASARALVPDPVDPRSGQRVFRSGDLAYRGPGGELYFCGRADSQVQIRGNRVELGEVEHRLLEFPGVTAAAALVVRRPDADPELRAFVVSATATGGQAASVVEAELGQFCQATLPGYMVPGRIGLVDEMPVTPNGKIDRVALAARSGP
ncbi:MULTISPECIES: AMP-binding protein [unclassified Micromonospora]|uniref:AMP-binding protein n=1 Tax=unclassified Micromonospora TaxID=2617518 RepID=UPI0036312806